MPKICVKSGHPNAVIHREGAQEFPPPEEGPWTIDGWVWEEYVFFGNVIFVRSPLL